MMGQNGESWTNESKGKCERIFFIDLRSDHKCFQNNWPKPESRGLKKICSHTFQKPRIFSPILCILIDRGYYRRDSGSVANIEMNQ